jgi:hypothetical protein
MFVRFRQTLSSLQVSLVENRRIDGKVRHEHVAGLGSIPEPMTTADRVAFWSALYQRPSRESQKPNKNNDIQRGGVSFMRRCHALRGGTFSPELLNSARSRCLGI